MVRNQAIPEDVNSIAFVCVQNAGRSQMATTFAERERDVRSIDVTIITGGTNPASEIHATLATVMEELDHDIENRSPREVTKDQLSACDLVITMGCDAANVCPAVWSGTSIDWDLDDPHGKPIERVREIRDDIQSRVIALFDTLEEQASEELSEGPHRDG